MNKIKSFINAAGMVRKWGVVVISIANWVGSCMDTFPVEAFKTLEPSAMVNPPVVAQSVAL